MRVAVIGGGIFGCTSAIVLARAGYDVALFERGADIMTAASAINQYRMHRGYHYPRCTDTIASCKSATPTFEEVYSEAIVPGNRHYYGIAKEGSHLSGEEYLRTLDINNLFYQIESPPHLNMDALDTAVYVEENLFDPHKLKEILTQQLQKCNVEVHFNHQVDVDDLDEFDFVVVASYAMTNGALSKRGDAQREYQYEVCEKIVVTIPDTLQGISTVIMDGPFMSFDPLGDTGFAVMGHVEHAIHAWNIGKEPEVPEGLAALLNRGIIKEPPISNAPRFLEHGAHFMPVLRDAHHVGSMFTIRTVLPKVDATDTRPTIVTPLDGRVITIYSGKIGNCVQAANDVLAIIEKKGN